MVCRHALVNGTPEDSYETIQDLTTSPFEEFSTVPDGSFVRKVRCDGGKVYDGLRECPECGAILIEQKPTDRGNGNGDDR